jgi:glyoxylase-like metal-dependent hydrolase (beta-lactamase superfamily II)
MDTTPSSQLPGIYRRRIGDIVVTAISDGHVDASYDMMRDIPPSEAEGILRGAFQIAPPRISVNCFVVHAAGRTALVDTGSGNSMGDQLGKLPQNLALAGVPAAAIDTVILTHMHPDHSNGLASPTGEAHFPAAELVVSEADVRHWHDDAAMSAASERHRERFFKAAREQIKPYWNRRRDAVGEVFPGVVAMPLPGHTPGHTGYTISSRGASLLIWGDIVHLPDIQVRRPEVYVDPDSDPVAAVATRRRIFETAAREGWLVAGMHMHFPGFLHLTGNAQQGYHLVPEAWHHVLTDPA